MKQNIAVPNRLKHGSLENNEHRRGEDEKYDC